MVLCASIFNPLTKYDEKHGASPTLMISTNLNGNSIYGKLYWEFGVGDYSGIKKEDFLALDVEAQIYRNCIPILLTQSPNFIPYLGPVSCTNQQLIDMATTDNTLAQALNKYVQVCNTKFGNNNWTKDGLSGYLTMNVENSMTLFEYLNTHPTENFDKIIAQVLLSLRIMGSMRLNHNDLHVGNILVQKLPKETILVYNYQDKIYHIKTDIKVYIFDWDFSWYPGITNPKIGPTQKRCIEQGLCNRFVKKIDLYTFLCDLLSRISRTQSSSLPRFQQFLKEAVPGVEKLLYNQVPRTEAAKQMPCRLGAQYIDLQDDDSMFPAIGQILYNSYFRGIYTRVK